MTPKLLLFKRLNIKPNGIISGGFVQYNADDVTGAITYNGEVDAHFLFFSKSFPASGTTTVDPKLLQSASFTPGATLTIGGVSMTVESLSGGQAVVSVVVNDGSTSARGTAIFDVSQKDISLLSLSAKGTVMGYSVTLEVES